MIGADVALTQLTVVTNPLDRHKGNFLSITINLILQDPGLIPYKYNF